ncbi:MAG: HNH endonuclease [Alcaligenaceae bacterium]|nr:MAG: HNH endonuclease [Alcaligenaceae bacterium]
MTAQPPIDPRLLALAAKVTAKRPKTVIDHIVANGYITNEDLKDTYGYNHPPRAIRDVREQGIPLQTYKVLDKTGRSIAAYRFDDPSKISENKLGGRVMFSKAFKQILVTRDGCRCAICSEKYEERYLTIDHRVPYEVAGDTLADERQPGAFMLVCGTCQRKKSWSCESCENWKITKSLPACESCYWAAPENYKHMAGREIRRIEVVWSGDEVASYDKLCAELKLTGHTVQDQIKTRLSDLD